MFTWIIPLLEDKTKDMTLVLPVVRQADMLVTEMEKNLNNIPVKIFGFAVINKNISSL